MGILNDSTIRRTLIVSTGLLCASLQGFASLEKTITIPITEQVRTKIQLSGIVTDKEGTPLIGATEQLPITMVNSPCPSLPMPRSSSVTLATNPANWSSMARKN